MRSPELHEQPEPGLVPRGSGSALYPLARRGPGTLQREEAAKGLETELDSESGREAPDRPARRAQVCHLETAAVHQRLCLLIHKLRMAVAVPIPQVYFEN